MQCSDCNDYFEETLASRGEYSTGVCSNTSQLVHSVVLCIMFQTKAANAIKKSEYIYLYERYSQNRGYYIWMVLKLLLKTFQR